MANPFLRQFAFGMSDEVNAINEMASKAFGVPLGGQQPNMGTPVSGAAGQPAPPPVSMPAAPTLAPTGPAVPTDRGRPGWDMVARAIRGGAESSGDPNTLYNNAQAPGGPFAGVRIADMTVDQTLDFQRPDGPYAAYVRGQVGRTATPVGMDQVVGTTLKAAKEGLGLRGDEIMTPELQDRIGKWIYDTQGTGAWEALNGKSLEQIAGMAVQGRSGASSFRGPAFKGQKAQMGDMTPTDFSEMEAEAKADLDPKKMKRQTLGATLSALGKGLGQMSHGDAVDVGDVFGALADRREAAKLAMRQVQQLKIADAQRLQGRTWDVADQQSSFDNQAAMANWQSDQTIAAEERGEIRGLASEIRQEQRGLNSEVRGETRTVEGENRGENRDIRGENRADTRQKEFEARNEGRVISAEERATGRLIDTETRQEIRDLSAEERQYGRVIATEVRADDRQKQFEERNEGRVISAEERATGRLIDTETRQEIRDLSAEERQEGRVIRQEIRGEGRDVRSENRADARQQAFEQRNEGRVISAEERATGRLIDTETRQEIRDLSAEERLEGRVIRQEDRGERRDIRGDLRFDQRQIAAENRQVGRQIDQEERQNGYLVDQETRQVLRDLTEAELNEGRVIRQEARQEARDNRYFDRNEEGAVRAETRGEARDNRNADRSEAGQVRAENREMDRIKARNEGVSSSILEMYKGQPFAETAAKVAGVDPDAAMAWAESQQSTMRAEAAKAKEAEQRTNLANYYRQNGQEASAVAVENGDVTGARDMFAEATGKTNDAKDAEIIMQGGPMAEAILKAKFATAGAVDSTTQMFQQAELAKMKADDEWMSVAKEKQGQLATMSAMLADPTMTGGALTARLLPMKTYLAEMGILDPTKVTKEVLFDALSKQVALNLQKAGQGSISDTERTAFAAAAPGLAKSPIANEVLIYAQNQAYERTTDRMMLERQYVGQGGDIKNPQARDEYVNNALKEKYGDKPLFPQVRDAAGAVAQPVGVPYMLDGTFVINKVDPATGRIRAYGG